MILQQSPALRPFMWELIIFAVIAMAASNHNVFGTIHPAARQWNHVINVILRSNLRPTIIATSFLPVILHLNIFSRKLSPRISSSGTITVSGGNNFFFMSFTIVTLGLFYLLRVFMLIGFPIYTSLFRMCLNPIVSAYSTLLFVVLMPSLIDKLYFSWIRLPILSVFLSNNWRISFSIRASYIMITFMTLWSKSKDAFHPIIIGFCRQFKLFALGALFENAGLINHSDVPFASFLDEVGKRWNYRRFGLQSLADILHYTTGVLN